MTVPQPLIQSRILSLREHRVMFEADQKDIYNIYDIFVKSAQIGDGQCKAFNQLAFWHMEFPERLTALRKERALTQQSLADLVGVHVLQIRRYEGGTSQPTLEVIKRLAQALRVSADALVFDAAERGPDEELRFQFEAVARMPKKEKDAIRTMLEAMIVKNQVARMLEGIAKAGSR